LEVKQNRKSDIDFSRPFGYTSLNATRGEERMLLLKEKKRTKRSLGQSRKEKLAVSLDFLRSPQKSEAATAHPHILFSPIHYEPSYAYPLLVWLHGRNNDENQLPKMMPHVSMRNYVAVAPKGLLCCEIEAEKPAALKKSPPWEYFDTEPITQRAERKPRQVFDWLGTPQGIAEAEERIFDCISIAEQHCSIASHRIFLAGFGSGGTAALRLAFSHPERFAGVASFGGALPKNERLLSQWNRKRYPSVFFGAGENSPVCSSAAVCDVLRICCTAGIDVLVREYPCGQELVPAMLQDLNRWMMEIVCS
jgi:phospholipase/carboxylesterase